MKNAFKTRVIPWRWPATLALVLLVGGCTSGPPPETAADAEVEEPAPQKRVMLSDMVNRQDPVSSVKYPEPPDGVWHEDDQGRQYFTMEVPKIEGDYRRLADGRVRLRHGLIFDLADETDDFFYMKVYKVEPRQPKLKVVLTDEQLAAIEATYATDVVEQDVIELVPFSEGLPTAGRWRNGFDVADMNEDGYLDLVHGPARATHGVPVIFLGDGSGGWTHWAKASFPRVGFDYGDVQVADIDGDGHLDMVLGMHGIGIRVLLGNGGGEFVDSSRGIDIETPGKRGRVAFSSKAIRIVDWNGDGRPDVLGLSEGPRGHESAGAGKAYGKLIYLANGDGTWRRYRNASGFHAVFGDHLAVADFDGDGLEDFVHSASVRGEKRLLNFHREDGSWEAVAIEPWRPRGSVFAVAVDDFDRDGSPDIALAFAATEGGVYRAGIDLLLWRDGEWKRRTAWVTREHVSIMAVGTGDLDGDGGIDLAALTHDGRLWILLEGETGGYVLDTPVREPVKGCRGYSVELVDLDADGADEIIADLAGDGCTGTGRIEVWKAERRPARAKVEG